MLNKNIFLGLFVFSMLGLQLGAVNAFTETRRSPEALRVPARRSKPSSPKKRYLYSNETPTSTTPSASRTATLTSVNPDLSSIDSGSDSEAPTTPLRTRSGLRLGERRRFPVVISPLRGSLLRFNPGLRRAVKSTAWLAEDDRNAVVLGYLARGGGDISFGPMDDSFGVNDSSLLERDTAEYPVLDTSSEGSVSGGGR
jgi:hypothetical protein